MRGLALHVLLTVGLALLGIGLVTFLVALLARAWAGHGRVPMMVGGCLIAVAVGIFISHRVAQHPICAVLGGRWKSHSEACADEWRRNSSNDPSNDPNDPWPWTSAGPESSWFDEF